MYYIVGSLSMEQRRLWWPVAGGPSTDTWERVALLAIPSTRENHCFILVVICDKRRGCTVIGVGRLTPIKRFILRHRGFGVIMKGMAQGANQWCQNQSVYEQLGVSALELRMILEDATWKAVFKVTRLHCNCHGQ